LSKTLASTEFGCGGLKKIGFLQKGEANGLEEQRLAGGIAVLALHQLGDHKQGREFFSVTLGGLQQVGALAHGLRHIRHPPGFRLSSGCVSHGLPMYGLYIYALPVPITPVCVRRGLLLISPHTFTWLQLSRWFFLRRILFFWVPCSGFRVLARRRTLAH